MPSRRALRRLGLFALGRFDGKPIRGNDCPADPEVQEGQRSDRTLAIWHSKLVVDTGHDVGRTGDRSELSTEWLQNDPQAFLRVCVEWRTEVRCRLPGELMGDENRFGPGTALVVQVIQFVDSGGVLRGKFRPSPDLPYPVHVIHSLNDVERFRSFEHPRSEIDSSWEWQDIRSSSECAFSAASNRVADWWNGPGALLQKEGLRFGHILRAQLRKLVPEDECLEIADQLWSLMMNRSVLGPNDLIYERLWRYYLASGYPCGWRGTYPDGELVVFST